MFLKPIVFDYEDTHFFGEEGSPDAWALFVSDEDYAYQWVAAFVSKEDAELFMKIKEIA